MDELTVLHQLDSGISETLDSELRTLLYMCFPHELCFKTRRFVSEPPPHRFIVFGDEGALAGHIAVHDKLIRAGDTELRVGGIAEVAVHPDHRGKGLVKAMLAVAHRWMVSEGIEFSLLFGKQEHYQSSGYSPLMQPIRYRYADGTIKEEENAYAMVACLADRALPKGVVDLQGPLF